MLGMNLTNALALDDYEQQVRSHHRTPEQRLCGAVVIRAVLDAAIDTVSTTAQHKLDAMCFILETSGVYSFEWFAAAAGLSMQQIDLIKRRIGNGGDSEFQKIKFYRVSTNPGKDSKTKQWRDRQKARRERERGVQRALFMASAEISEINRRAV